MEHHIFHQVRNFSAIYCNMRASTAAYTFEFLWAKVIKHDLRVDQIDSNPHQCPSMPAAVGFYARQGHPIMLISLAQPML